jgi:hypothetical protein
MNFFRSFVATIVLGSISVISLNYMVDPLRFFGPESIAKFEKQTRYRFPGLIRNQQYDSIFVGTSMSHNFIIADIDRLFDTKSLLLPMSGASLFEQSLMVKMALATSRPKTVFWEIYDGVLAGRSGEARKGADFPFYMYDKNILNDIFYVFNFTNTLSSISAIKNNLEGKKVNHNAWRTKEYRAHKYAHGCPYMVVEQMRGGGILNSNEDLPNNSSDIRTNIDKNLLSIIKENPEVEFILFAPPVSSLYQALLLKKQPNVAAALHMAKSYAYPRLLTFKNVRIYDFYTDKVLTHDLSHYRDFMHYSGELSHQLLQAMKNGRNRVMGNWYQTVLDHKVVMTAYPAEQHIQLCSQQSSR